MTAPVAIRQERRRTDDACAPVFIDAPTPPQACARDEVIEGLSHPRARISPKFFYDELGSTLFEAITRLDEYYPTRTEAAILAEHADDIGRRIGPGCTMIDLGAGNCAKAPALFDVLRPERYLAVDISSTFVKRSVERLAAAYPRIAMVGIGMDFSASLDMPAQAWPSSPMRRGGAPLFFYPGSSIGNFSPSQALAFLQRIAEQARGGGLLIGVDLVKPSAELKRAYDDALGVTAAFNRNLLRNLNRIIGADFEPERWVHVALFNEVQSRVEMHLEASDAMTVSWDGGQRRFASGERIHTESSYKYTIPRFAAMLRQSGFGVPRHWTDAAGRYAVFHAPAA